jgi:hypothetical protein
MTEALVALEKRKLKSTVRASWIVLTLAFLISITFAGYIGAIESAGFSILALFYLVAFFLSSFRERKLYLIDWDFKIHEIRPLRIEE